MMATANEIDLMVRGYLFATWSSDNSEGSPQLFDISVNRRQNRELTLKLMIIGSATHINLGAPVWNKALADETGLKRFPRQDQGRSRQNGSESETQM